MIIIKQFCLYFCKWIGLFRLATFLTRKKLRILCYHNFAEGSVTKWLPSLFITPRNLQKRLHYLTKMNYSPLSLNSALAKLDNDALPNLPVVITLDDGWHTTLRLAHPIFTRHNMPYTVYINSFFCQKNIPVYNLIIPFFFWLQQRNEKAKREKRSLISYFSGRKANRPPLV